MTVIAETYIHLRPYGADDQDLQELGDAAVKIAIEAARRVYGFEVEVEVYLEQGSLVTWIKYICLAGIPALYGGIAIYPDFKQGLHELVEDARSVGDATIGPFINEAGATPEEVYRTERRTKTPGKLERGIGMVENASNSVEYQQALQQLRVALADLPTDQSAKVMELVRNEFPKLTVPQLSAPRYPDIGTLSTIGPYPIAGQSLRRLYSPILMEDLEQGPAPLKEIVRRPGTYLKRVTVAPVPRVTE